MAIQREVKNPRPLKNTPRARFTQKNGTWILFLLPALAVYIIFMAAPLFDSLRLSLYTGSGYTLTTFVGLKNYIELFTNPLWVKRFTGALLHTCVFFAIHMSVQNTLGL